jgi:glc operon protein GlcG
MTLTSDDAWRMITASQDKARELGILISTAIVDAEGRLCAFARMDGAGWGSIEVAQAKAFTAALFRRDGTDVQQIPAATVASLSNIFGRGLIASASITPLLDGDQLIAGIGCSGASDDQDAECAHAARRAYQA